MVPLDKLAQIAERFEFLEAQLNAGAAAGEIARISREYTDLKPVVEEIRAYRQALDDLAEAEAMLSDPEMKALAEEELPRLKARIPEMEQALRLALLPKDAADPRPAIIEIRPGTGGDEAALFAGDLARMYQRYAERMGWTFEVISEQAGELGGLKEFSAHIQGEGVYARMKYESGVHRVQRVPETEAQGRIHTSAATVAVLPEADGDMLMVAAEGHRHLAAQPAGEQFVGPDQPLAPHGQDDGPQLVDDFVGPIGRGGDGGVEAQQGVADEWPDEDLVRAAGQLGRGDEVPARAALPPPRRQVGGRGLGDGARPGRLLAAEEVADVEFDGGLFGEHATYLSFSRARTRLSFA